MAQIEIGRVPERRGPVAPDDDFFCLRFQVSYSSFDCAFRTKYRTCPSCACCEQGRFNLQRHRRALARARLPLPVVG